MQGGASARTAAYWVVREERTRSDNAADGPSWPASHAEKSRSSAPRPTPGENSIVVVTGR
jgi:hypothetical protein